MLALSTLRFSEHLLTRSLCDEKHCKFYVYSVRCIELLSAVRLSLRTGRVKSCAPRGSGRVKGLRPRAAAGPVKGLFFSRKSLSIARHLPCQP